ncbi:hypothetical protein DES40_1678 [Litorimonas taeanensis]|uniref:Uncharacterized protein n=1 Tax=Litorimonas taeanensis TaxID=568099 RepID=A0A420WD44_9PROT|nr:hypothetical protein [Litorimonas taeanensis]RKQ68903.1 hypothetical protein DES40_1678 [Litorimonas taeanensis]
MSDLFRKEALENRSRSLYGEVVLRSALSTWVLTGLILLIALLALFILFGLQVETEAGSMSVIKWLLTLG